MYCARLIVFVVAFLVVTETLAGIAPQQITVTELIPLTSSRKEFKIIDGKDQGRLVPLTFQADPADEKRWKLSFGDYGRISLRSSSGALIMDRLDLFNSKSYVIYAPHSLAYTRSSSRVQRNARADYRRWAASKNYGRSGDGFQRPLRSRFQPRHA